MWGLSRPRGRGRPDTPCTHGLVRQHPSTRAGSTPVARKAQQVERARPFPTRLRYTWRDFSPAKTRGNDGGGAGGLALTTPLTFVEPEAVGFYRLRLSQRCGQFCFRRRAMS